MTTRIVNLAIRRSQSVFSRATFIFCDNCTKPLHNGILSLPSFSTLASVKSTSNYEDDTTAPVSSTSTNEADATIPVTFVSRDGSSSTTVNAKLGVDLMTVAVDNDIDLEGACGGELACSTCHCIFDEDIYDTLPEKDEEEDDMLDLALDLTETSRLGCQIPVTKDLAGIKIRLPRDDY
eukprot:CAMPEP_0194272886 /NCGR_PEP_ID=MMETSP0169-20130528/6341_1 /TAXON_ID=218684 /ORGANISM="Corethron pennatum, Strain L29A3" /LENGTH=178 /DNA_ID=CAMNT_0039015671 /DNA_START=125 /DNA_END=661 /DNA_ORIENTATION=+